MRVVFWNIRAGGGVRAAAIARQIAAWEADAVALAEFRGTPPSGELARDLARLGLPYQWTTADPARPASTGSCWPRAGRCAGSGSPARPASRAAGCWPASSPEPLALGVMHVPNRVGGRKYPFLDAVLTTARARWATPALLVGDTNSGRIGLDEQVPAFNRIEDGWMRELDEAGWTDAYRHLRGAARAYTWYSPNGGNGFRIDQAFLNRALQPRLRRFRYDWGRRSRLTGRPASDHAAMVLDLAG